MTFKEVRGQKDFGIDRGWRVRSGNWGKGDDLVRAGLMSGPSLYLLIITSLPKAPSRNSFISFSLWIRTGLISHPQSFIIPLQLPAHCSPFLKF